MLTHTNKHQEANDYPVCLSLKALKELNDTQGTKAGEIAPFYLRPSNSFSPSVPSVRSVIVCPVSTYRITTITIYL